MPMAQPAPGAPKPLKDLPACPPSAPESQRYGNPRLLTNQDVINENLVRIAERIERLDEAEMVQREVARAKAALEDVNAAAAAGQATLEISSKTTPILAELTKLSAQNDALSKQILELKGRLSYIEQKAGGGCCVIA